MKHIIRIAAVLLVSLFGVCCTETDPPTIEVESVTINTKAIEMVIGQTMQLSATVEPKNATDNKVSWSSSDATVVSVSSSGLVTALKEGKAIITALAGKCVSLCQISVRKETVEVAFVTLDLTDAVLTVGESFFIKATITPENASVQTVTWSSSNIEVVIVDDNGKVTAVKEGSATIIAQAGGKTAECPITVISNIIDVSSVELDQTSVSLKTGETVTLIATVKPDDATNKTVEWASSDETIATVDNEGKVTAVKEGSVTITAKTADKKATCSVSIAPSSFEPNGEYFSLTAIDYSSVSLDCEIDPQIEFSYDKKTWQGWNREEIILYPNSTVSFRAKDWHEGTFKMKGGRISATGNIMSLLYYDDFEDKYEIPQNKTFTKLFFRCTNLISAPDLPATVLSNMSYYQMFYGCTSLTVAPELPSMSLAGECYCGMFFGCTSLAIAPELPATIMATNCYRSMFEGCTSLTVAPELPSMSLAYGCYCGMFEGCTSLTKAPELPANELSNFCYQRMFKNCKSITNTPFLPAMTLAESCYEEMFHSCSGITAYAAPELSARTLAKNCYKLMFHGSGLTKAPDLPATSLVEGCYESMFSGLEKLTAAPNLPAATLAKSCYEGMFSYSAITKAPELPATTLAESCYEAMFVSCKNLTIAPILPVTTLAEACYKSMFAYTGLIKAPELPATTLAKSCYEEMFKGCHSLSTPPDLPAMTLAESCYKNMFMDIWELVNAPKTLPATTLAKSCYEGMFANCYMNLSKVPELPALYLVENCYTRMFYHCFQLNKVKMMAVGFLSKDVFSEWLSEVSKTGTFVKNAEATWDEKDIIPSGWTVIRATE